MVMLLDCWWKISLLLLANHVVAFTTTTATASRSWQLYSTPPQKKPMSAAQQARREEDLRRLRRKEDVVIGQTSAKRGARDLRLDPKATEEEWLRQATRLEQQVFQLTGQGMEAFKMCNLEDASEAFDEVLRIKPEAYLWQAGLVKFYLDDVETAANLFAKNAAIYESRFGGKASEERIWRSACVLKLASETKTKKGSISKEAIQDVASKLLPMPDPTEEEEDSLFKETRTVMGIVSSLFEASVTSDASGVILARAKLRSIGGNFEDIRTQDLKQRKLQSWFFLGLHYDSVGEIEESIECMKMALKYSPNTGNADNILFVLPLIHMCQRDLFDDDDVDANPLKLLQPTISRDKNDHPSANVQEMINAKPLLADSIRKSIAKMSLPELQNALLVRGVKSSGIKQDLQDRLFENLINDILLSP